MYGIVFTSAGLELLASLVAGEKLTITRCMVGTGSVGTAEAAMALTDLVEPAAAATSTKPVQKDNQCSLILEFRNDLNGGLERSIDITEFGVWAQIGSAAEVLLLVGCLGDHPHPVGGLGPGRRGGDPALSRDHRRQQRQRGDPGLQRAGLHDGGRTWSSTA